MQVTIREYSIFGADSGPYQITVGLDGALWFTEQKGNRIGRISLNGEIDGFHVPTLDAGVMCIVSDKQGALWFTEWGSNHIGRITTDGEITEYAIPTTNAEPHGIVLGPDGDVWFAEECNKIGRLTATMTESEDKAFCFL